jgi:hypothetical protein
MKPPPEPIRREAKQLGVAAEVQAKRPICAGIDPGERRWDTRMKRLFCADNAGL